MEIWLLSTLAVTLSCILMIPQAVRVFRSGEVGGLSLWTIGMQTANACLWIAWAAMMDAWAAGIPSFFNLPVLGYLAFRVMVSRRSIEMGRGEAIPRL